jgi:hypothetical protein
MPSNSRNAAVTAAAVADYLISHGPNATTRRASSLHGIRWLVRAAVFILAVVLGSAPAFGETKTFSNDAGGSWHIPSNWSPAGVPAATDHVILPDGSGNISISTANVTVQSVTIRRPLTLSRSLTVTTASVEATFTLANAATLEGGTYTIGTGGGFVFPCGPGCGFALLSNLTINGTLDIANAGIRWRNVTLNGAMNIAGTSTTNIAFLSDTTINFPITITNSGPTSFNHESAGTLTVAAGVTITGGGITFGPGLSVGSSTTAIINNGIIRSSVADRQVTFSHPLTNNGQIIAAPGSVSISSVAANTGLIDSSSGAVTIGGPINPLDSGLVGNNFSFFGTVNLNGGTWDLTDRAFLLKSNCRVQNGTINMSNGMLSFELRVGCGPVTFSALTINGDLTLPGVAVRWSNVTLNGGLNISGTGENAILFEGNNVLSFPITFGSDARLNLGQATAGTLVIPADRVLSGGRISFNSTSSCGASPMNLFNNGQIIASGPAQPVTFYGAVTLTNNGVIDGSAGPVTFLCPVNPLSGTLLGTSFTFANTIDLSGGTWNLTGYTLSLTGGASLRNGTVVTSGTSFSLACETCTATQFSNITVNGDLNLRSGVCRWSGVTLNGSLNVLPSSSTRIRFLGNATISFPVNVPEQSLLTLQHETSGTLTIPTGVTVTGGGVTFGSSTAGQSNTTSIINNGTIISGSQFRTVAFYHPLTNSGMIIADPGSVLINSTLVNNGTISSPTGPVNINTNANPTLGTYLGTNTTFNGTISLNGATWNLAGQTIRLSGTSVVQNGTISTAGGTLIFPQGGSCGGSRLNGVTINGDLTLNDGGVRWRNVTITGSLIVSGTATSTIGFEGSNVLNFPILTAASASLSLTQVTPGTLTIPSGQVISGRNVSLNTGCGVISPMTLINNGTITASNTITIGPGVTVSNNGVFDARSGSLVALSSFNPTAGTYLASYFGLGSGIDLGGGTWNLDRATVGLGDGVTLRSGTIVAPNGFRMTFPCTFECPAARINDLTINGDLTITSGAVRWRNIALNGSLRTGTASSSLISFFDGTTINFPIYNASNYLSLTIDTGGPLVVGESGSITGDGISIGSFSGFGIAATGLINLGRIEGLNNQLPIRISWPYSGSGELWGSVTLNDVILTAPFSTAGPTNNASFSGVRTAPVGGTPSTLTFRSLDIAPGSRFALGVDETLVLSNGQGLVRVGAGGLLLLDGTVLGGVVNQGKVVLPSTRLGTVSRIKGGLAQVGIAPPPVPPTALNPVDLSIDAPLTVNTGSLLQIGGSGFTVASGNVAANYYRISGGSVAVNGTLTWDGQLSVNGAYTQASSGSVRLFIAGPAVGETASRLTVGQTATLSGTLQVILQPELLGFTPSVGDSFDLVTAADGIVLPTLPNSLQVQTLMTSAGAARLGITLPVYTSGTAGDPNSLVSLPPNMFNISLVNNGRTLRATLINPICAATVGPEPVTTCIDGTASFSVGVSGSGPFAFQWQARSAADTEWTILADGGNPLIGLLTGSTAATLSISNINASAGDLRFRCVVISPCGSTSTEPVTLTAPSRCSLADLVGTLGGPVVCGDSTVDGSDFIAFINSFAIGDAAVDATADVAGGGDNGEQPDGTIDGSDFIAFINAFAIGC